MNASGQLDARTDLSQHSLRREEGLIP